MKKRILAVLLLLCMLLPIVACDSGDDSGSTTTLGDGETTTADPGDDDDPGKISEDELGIIVNGKTEYAVVLADDASGALKRACTDAIEKLAAKTGATLTVKKASDAATAKEILIGDTGRTESNELKASANPAGTEFAVKVVGEKVVAIGGNAGKDVLAAEYALCNAIMSDSASKCATIEKNYDHKVVTSKAIEIVRSAKNFYDFIVDPFTEDATFGRITFTGNHGWRLQTKAHAGDDFKDTGASQRLAISLGEEAPATREDITVTPGSKFNTLKASDGSYVKLYLESFSLEVYSASGNLAANIMDISNSDEGCSISGLLNEGEAVYGTGERFNGVNQRGKRVDIYTYDMWNQDNGCYMAIPLLCFTRGSGVFLNMYERMMMDLGKSNEDEWSSTISVEGSQLDCYIFATDVMSDVLYGYSALSGFAAQPEEWTYGMIVCRYSPDFSTIKGIELAIDMMEYFDLPWTGLLLESWSTYSANESHNNELKALCEKVHAMGKKVMVYIRMGDPGASAAGFVDSYRLRAAYVDEATGQLKTMTDIPQVKNGDPNPDNGGSTMTYLDITNEQAVNWYFDTMWYNLSQVIGVDGAKIDFCEEIPENYQLLYADGTTETQGSHHWYPVYFCSLYWNMISKLPDGGMCFTRGGGIGSQRNPFMWAGDQARDMAKMKVQVRALLSSGLSGVPYMSYDMSGYQYSSYGGRILYDSAKYVDISVDDEDFLTKVQGLMYYADSNSTRKNSAAEANIMPTKIEAETFVRGTEFTAFSANMQTHGKVRRSYDFAMEGDTVTTDIYRAYVKLHESLAPYITEYATIASTTGMPIVRHLALKWQNDENVYNIDDEYMFGDAFLVAPIVTNGSGAKLVCKRDIYLPEGKWKDLNSGKTYDVGEGGQKLTGYIATLSQIPVFLNLNNDSETVDDVLPAVEEIFAYVKTLTYSYE